MQNAVKQCILIKVVPRGLEPRSLRLLAVRSNQLSYETDVFIASPLGTTFFTLGWVFAGGPPLPGVAPAQGQSEVSRVASQLS